MRTYADEARCFDRRPSGILFDRVFPKRSAGRPRPELHRRILRLPGVPAGGIEPTSPARSADQYLSLPDSRTIPPRPLRESGYLQRCMYVSTIADQKRYDWLVCPNRALDPSFMSQAARHIFRYEHDEVLHFIAAPTLVNEETRDLIRLSLQRNERVLIYFQEKLGGELSISKTDASPELSFDWTLIEIRNIMPVLSLGKFGVLEVQTMDFHGSYKHAVSEVRQLLAADPEQFHAKLSTPAGRQALSKKMEGPNISNVFKRTFYQMVYKFQIGDHEDCAGCGFVIPLPVWESWRRHLGNPTLQPRPDGTYSLESPRVSRDRGGQHAWIFVFSLSDTPTESRRTITPWRIIRTDAETLIDLALVVSPYFATQTGGPVDKLKENASLRIARLWPEIVPSKRGARLPRKGVRYEDEVLPIEGPAL